MIGKELWNRIKLDAIISSLSFGEVPCMNSILAVSISTSFLIDKLSIAEVMKQKQYDLLEIKTDYIAPGYPLYNDDVLHYAYNEALCSKIQPGIRRFIK